MAETVIVTGRAEGARAVITVAGELYLPTMQQAERDIRAARKELGEHLVFDLAALDFIDSTGLNTLVKLYLAAEARGGSAAFAGPLAEQVARAFEISNLGHRLRIHPSVDHALRTGRG
ncbi:MULTISPECIES: STAS domain-containing protein [Actinomadura]|uniref:Anti-sigma factor antagonist n=1 Tax=Actinomadura yumaensis TaxID=111807 RepID=A0ABW2CZI2_9ACTN|nr:STAS domain-containing protein [Actinomadura sp. J1-007]